jgi:uncharacterized protein YuzE
MSDAEGRGRSVDWQAGYLRVNGGDVVARTIEADPGVLVDVDAEGQIMGLEVIGHDDFFRACMAALRVLRVAP